MGSSSNEMADGPPLLSMSMATVLALYESVVQAALQQPTLLVASKV